MKKVISLFAVCMAVIFSIPVLDVSAANASFVFSSRESVYGSLDDVEVFDYDNLKKNEILQSIYSVPQTEYSTVYTAYNSFTSEMSDCDLFFIYANPSDTTGYEFVGFDSSKISDSLLYCQGWSHTPGAWLNKNYSVLFSGAVNNYRPLRMYYNSVNNIWVNDGAAIFTAESTYIYFTFTGTLLFSNLRTVNYADIQYNSDGSRSYMWNNKENVFNYSSVNLGYTNSSGNNVSVDPDVVYESNKNHMYFKDCEIGFCYPKSSPAPVSFGGAYFYIKYQVDDWIVNHISDYNLVFYADAEVGNEVTNTIRYEIALDPDGCITIPFSRVWASPLTSKGFSVLVTDHEVEDNFYKAYLYSLSPSGFVNFGNKAAASNQNSISGALSALTSGGIQSFLYYINGDQIDFYSAMSDVATSIAVKYNPYLITAFTLLTDGEDNSGLFEMEFDLVAGTEDVTDTGGLVNPDPFVPDDDPDFTPPAPTPGNSTTPGYNIVPSGYWQGTMKAVIGYDPGYRDLKADLDKDPDDNFTQYLAPFKNNEVGGFVGDFLDDMPTALKTIFVGGFGVLTLLGIYRFIRRG